MGFITIAGENQIATKQGGSLVLNITNFVLANIVGLGAEPADRIEAMPGAGDIVATLPYTKGGYVNTNQVVYSLTMDSTLGDYDFNWIGLVDDEGVLIAVAYTPTIEKRKTVGSVQGNNLTRNFLLAYSDIQATTAIAVPAETWQIDFTARLLGIDERERLSNFDLYGAEIFIDAGWQVARQAATTTYDILPGIGYVGGIRADNAATQQVVMAGVPTSLWLDVSLQGDITGVAEVVDFIINAAAQVDYTDGLGFDHYVTKLADIAADGSVTDARTGTTLHEKKDDPHSQYLTQDEVDAVCPIGIEAPWYTDTAPIGWLIEDGALYSMTAYHRLDNHFEGTTTLDAGLACTFDDVSDKALLVAHGLVEDTIIRFTNAGGALPAELTARYSRYYVVNATADDFQLATNQGGAPIDLTDTGTGVHSFHEKLAVPNPRGRGIRITDGGAGVDPDAATRTDRGDGVGGDAPGSKQDDAMQGHWHNLAVRAELAAGGSGGGTLSASNQIDANAVQDAISDGVNGAPRTSSESRMINEGRHLIIRAY